MCHEVWYAGLMAWAAGERIQQPVNAFPSVDQLWPSFEGKGTREAILTVAHLEFDLVTFRVCAWAIPAPLLTFEVPGVPADMEEKARPQVLNK